MKKLDWYIIKKFLGTFFFSIMLILSIAIVFDMTEKMDDFFEDQLTWKEIIMGYYIHFIPYYANMFSSLFIFISVIFFTSKLAGNSEIIAILASGVSYERFLLPYFISATMLFGLGAYLAGYVIPPASKHLLTFTDKHFERFSSENTRNVQMEVEPGTILYIETFQRRTSMGYRASLEHFDGKVLTSRITAERIRHIEDHKWRMESYIRRDFNGMRETLTRGERLDTIIAIEPDELFMTAESAQMMTNPELRDYMERANARGSGNIQAFETEWHKRWAGSIGAFIMTLLGVTMSSKKVRGGMGKNLGIGIVLFMAAWLPNLVFLVIGIALYFRVRR